METERMENIERPDIRIQDLKKEIYLQVTNSCIAQGRREKPKPWNNNFLKPLSDRCDHRGRSAGSSSTCICSSLCGVGACVCGIFDTSWKWASVLAAVAVMISGFVTAVVGIVELFSFPALGLVACGGGMILCVVGLAATVFL